MELNNLFRFEPISQAFWSDDLDAVIRESEKLTSRPSVIIIDPLAIFNDKVQNRITRWLRKILDNKNALVMVLAPFPLPNSSSQLRHLILQMIDHVYENYYISSPLLMGNSLAHCSANIGDELDLKRWLSRIIRSQPEGQASHTYLQLKGP